MSPQQLFNTAYSAILAQGAPSYDRDVGCLYRAPHGRRTPLPVHHDKVVEEDDFLSTYIWEMEKVAIRFDLEIPCNIPETTN